MTARELLDECEKLGASIALERGRLVVSAPRPIGDELLARLRSMRSELLAVLSAPPTLAQGESISPRAEAAALIRRARRQGLRARAVAMRDAWRERLALCSIEGLDGGVSPARAEVVARDELRQLAAQWRLGDEAPAPANRRFAGARTPLTSWNPSLQAPALCRRRCD